MTPTSPLPALPENWARALCVAAHPDDIEYGTASAIAKWTSQGKQVTYLIATSGEAGIDGMHPDEFLPWLAATAGAQMGVPAAVLFDVHILAFEGPPSWAASDDPN